jgi:hypothetical protein
VPEQHDDDVDQDAVGERVGDLPEGRLDVPAAREEAVDLIGDGRSGEEQPCGPARLAVRREDQHGDDRDHGKPCDRQRVRQRRERRRDGTTRHCGARRNCFAQ